MTTLEKIAIELHYHIWSNLGVTDDWPLQICGDDDTINELIRLLSQMQEEIVASGLPHKRYYSVEIP